jgi:PAS domain S-box-containing protein
VWFSYERIPENNHLIGLGFLTVAVFNLAHIIFFPGLITQFNYGGLAAWYWIIGRLTEAMILYLIVRDFKLVIKKWSGLAATVILAIGVSYLLFIFMDNLPMLMNKEGHTTLKVTLEYVIMGVYIVTLYNLKDKINNNSMFSYHYIMCAIILAIPGDFCLTIFKTSTSFYNTTGHLFKVAYCIFLIRGIFECALVYPYEKIEENNRYSSRILNDIPMGIVLYNASKNVSFVNKKALRMLGCKEEELLGLTPEMIGSIFKYHNNYLNRLTDGKKSLINQIIEIVNKSGEKCKFKADYYKKSNDYLVLFVDAKKEQELVNLKLQTQTILNSIYKLIFLVDKNSRIIMCNNTCLEALEMEGENLTGMNVKTLCKRFKLEVTEEMNGLFEGKKVVKEWFETSIVTAKGNKKDLFLHVDPIENIEGEMIGAIAIATDVTNFKIENLKIQQNEKLIMLGQMAAGIVHEIKNPLTSIKGFSQLIKYKAQDEKVLEFARLIDEETDTINRFICDFLKFAKPRHPVLQKVTLNAVLDSMKVMIDTNTFLRGIELKINLTAEDKKIMADADQLKQVILNIVKNAMEATMDIECPQINISTWYNKNTDEMSVTIHNNGKPMSAEEKMMAGTPFFTTKSKGTGLGLSICSQIIREHGGRMEIETAEEMGTSFTIYIPCQVNENQANMESIIQNVVNS